jgi:signal transduction histidine kinase
VLGQNEKHLSEENTNEVLNQLLEFSEALLNGNYSKRMITGVNDTPLSQICLNLNKYADEVQFSKTSGSHGAETHLMDFMEVISSYANREFGKKLKISDSSNVIDAIATGINILGEELEHSTVSKDELEKERDQLKMAKEVAEEANKAKTVFLGNLSHEIRTPLQGILGFSEIVLTEVSAEKRKKYIEIIIRRANDLGEIIEALLDLATLEAGQVSLDIQPVNLCQTFEKIFHDFHEEHRDRINPVKILIRNNISANNICMVDPLHLRQVILNLMNNGIKFTDKGYVEMSCEELKDHYLIKIIDTGIGITKEQISVIFEPFRQAHEGFSRSKGGIGLGLPICKKRVELWGGSIDVISKPGKGSTFSFTIPVK